MKRAVDAVDNYSRGMTADAADTDQGSTVDRIVDHARNVVPDRPEFEPFLRVYFAHVDEADLEARHVANLFGMAADHLQLADTWDPGTIAIEVVNPRVEVDGWVSDHTVVRIVAGDMPFLVDSVTMELSRLGAAIHLVAHPVLARDNDGSDEALRWQHSVAGGEGDQLLSLMSVEIDRQATAEDRQAIADNLRRVLNDVRRAVDDWRAMKQRMVDVSDAMADSSLPVDETEVAEARELLDWLADDHFIFVGARDYALDTIDGEEVLRIVSGSGLGVLEEENHLGRPRALSELGPTARRRVHEPRLLNLTKAGTRSTVHRATFLDYVGIKTFSDDGEVTGERRFLGLYTSEVYNRAIDRIPGVRDKVQEVVRRAGYPAGGHDEKRLKTILERYPRDDLMQMSADELYDVAISIAALQERRKVRIFARRELFGRFVTVLVYLPRDRYNTTIRTGIERILGEAYEGEIAAWDAELSESVLARLRFVLQVTDTDDEVDTAGLEERIELLTRLWADGLTEAIEHDFSDDEGLRNSRRYREAFSPGYQQAFDPRTASADIAEIEQLVEWGDMRLRVYREPGHAPGSFRLKLYRRGEPVSLSRVMPSLTNLGVIVVHERPYEVRPLDSDPVWIYDFSLEHDSNSLDFATASDLVEEAFEAVWRDEVEDDGLNQLVLGAGMSAADVSVLRAYSHYLRQVGLNYSPTFVVQTLDAHPDAARLLVELFRVRFTPDVSDDVDRAAEIADIEARLAVVITAIESLDEDRVLRRFLNLIVSTVRTTWAQRNDEGERRPYLAFKFDPRALEELPEPRPRHEIFVYSPRFEGVHLRGGDVARGGLRWSDRTEDFRTEVLGLVKAQMVKNSVIVPAGAKGGFVLKRRPDAYEDVRQEVVECYKLFISGLLDLTDNLVDGAVVPPDNTVRYDGDDTYLVVAADKGTATFSDIANELAVGRGFWLGDAFASGGSNGYDHKAMGITARGAWESVKRHFRELGVEVQSEPFTAVGIGDMSGDVFGNGMLRSPFTKLIAAFDHRHIFIDPNPDPAASYTERQRLYDLPRSSWADYNPDLLSAGGAIIERSAKTVTLSPEAQTALGTDIDVFTPNELISAVLRAPVQLFWNGGIGTYIKAASESHAEVGDKANDRIRVNGRDLRCSVVGEGGNLGFTQLGRIEYAMNGGRINTDAIDNSAGVDCSDHEVNIKIAFRPMLEAGNITMKRRNNVLEKMTDEVSRLVLRDNLLQTQAISTAQIQGLSLLESQARMMDAFEQRDFLNRKVEFLPNSKQMKERKVSGDPLTRPELSVLLSYAKMDIYRELLDSSFPEESYLEQDLLRYFPTQMRKTFVEQIMGHRLRNEIIATSITNSIVNRAGITFFFQIQEDTGLPACDIARAYVVARDAFGVRGLWRDIEEEESLPAATRAEMLAQISRFLERVVIWMLRNLPQPLYIDKTMERFAEGIEQYLKICEKLISDTLQKAYEEKKERFLNMQSTPNLANRIARLEIASSALDVLKLAQDNELKPEQAGKIYFELGARLRLGWLRREASRMPVSSYWERLAAKAVISELFDQQRRLAETAIPYVCKSGSCDDTLDSWAEQYEKTLGRFSRFIDDLKMAEEVTFPMLVIALRNVEAIG